MSDNGCGTSVAANPTAQPTHSPTDASVLTSWPLLLRVLGYLLDARGVRTCELQVAMSRSNTANGLEPLAILGGREELDARAFFLLLLRLRARVLDPTIQPAERNRLKRRAIADGDKGTLCASASLVCESSRCTRFSS